MVVAALVAAGMAGCARAVAPPSADGRQRPFPDLGGRTVMLLPVQSAVPSVAVPGSADPSRGIVPLPADARAALDAELSYWLPEQARRTRWVLPDAIDAAVRRSPAIDVRVRELTVRDFQRARLDMIGDPLYGELRRVAALVDARPALLPIGAVWIPEQAGGGRVHLAVALIDTFGGDVVWSGVVAGTAGSLSDAAVIASVAEALARMIPL
jgi:hypothetical protein